VPPQPPLGGHEHKTLTGLSPVSGFVVAFLGLRCPACSVSLLYAIRHLAFAPCAERLRDSCLCRSALEGTGCYDGRRESVGTL